MSFRERTGVAHDDVRRLLERDGLRDLLSGLDFQLYRADATAHAELAEATFGWLAALDDADPERAFERPTIYVREPLAALAARAPDSLFATMLDRDPDADVYPVSDAAEFRFGRTHGETVPVRTRYHDIEFAVPTLEAYVAYGESAFDDG
jgi:hypothetical protein